MKDLIDAIEKGIPSGKVTTFEKYFQDNPQSVYRNSGNTDEKAVMINGVMIVIGSQVWNNIANTAIYNDTLFGELRVLYHTKRSNISNNGEKL